MVTVSTLVGGADLGGSCFVLSQLQQLLALEEAGDAGDFSAGADVGVKEPLEAEGVTKGREVGRPSKTNLVLAPVGSGLISAGDSVLRKSR